MENPFEYAPGEEPPRPTHKPIGICECCGRTAYTKVDSVRVCWSCAKASTPATCWTSNAQENER